MLIEIEQRHHRRSIDDVFREIQSLGYEGAFLPTERRRSDNKASGSLLAPLSDFLPATHQSGDPMGRNYINNFVFRHKASI